MLKILLDICIFSFSLIASFLIRFEFIIPFEYWDRIVKLLPIIIIIRIILFFYFKIYDFDYRYFSVPNVLSIFKSVSYSSILISIIFLGFQNYFQCPRSILIIDWLFLFVTVCGTRYVIRCLKNHTLLRVKDGTRVLIFGAGDAGESILRQIKCYKYYNYLPIGLIDDNPEKQGKIIQGIKVLGNIKNLPQLIRHYKIDILIIAIPSVENKKVTEIMQTCEEFNIKILTVPYLCEINSQELLIHQLKEIKPEDILFREQIEWDGKCLFKELNGKKIMVTGAGGSIGTELCRQISRYKPALLILFERSEYNLFCIDKELKENFPDLSLQPVAADMTDFDLTLKIIKSFKPDIIFHAAAYKHVYLMELNPEVAIKNNVIGTMNITHAAMQAHVSKLVLISSDKAVNPSSIMGASKRICEEYIKQISYENGNKFFGVRFGNVLGSSGSVLEIFKNQIAKGGPITITDINAYRYFMTITEAVHLVLQTLTFAKGREIFILDMGDPVRIYDLAKKLLDKSGLKPRIDIEIAFTGLKKGEKLSEQLFEENEKLESTPHNKILKIKNNNNSINLLQLNNDINELLTYATEMNRVALIQKIKQIIPTFKSTMLEITSDRPKLTSLSLN